MKNDREAREDMIQRIVESVPSGEARLHECLSGLWCCGLASSDDLIYVYTLGVGMPSEIASWVCWKTGTEVEREAALGKIMQLAQALVSALEELGAE